MNFHPLLLLLHLYTDSERNAKLNPRPLGHNVLCVDVRKSAKATLWHPCWHLGLWFKCWYVVQWQLAALQRPRFKSICHGSLYCGSSHMQQVWVHWHHTSTQPEGFCMGEPVPLSQETNWLQLCLCETSLSPLWIFIRLGPTTGSLHKKRHYKTKHFPPENLNFQSSLPPAHICPHRLRIRAGSDSPHSVSLRKHSNRQEGLV